MPDEVNSFVKDSLRGARYLVRHGTHAGQRAVSFVPGIPDLASLADMVLTVTGKTATALLLKQDHDFEFSGTVYDMLEAFLAEAGAVRRRRLFVRLHYRLIKAVLRRLGVGNVFVSEQMIAASYDIMRRRYRTLLAAPREAGPLRFWVAGAVTLGARHPLRRIDLPRQDDPRRQLLKREPTLYCLLIAALTGAILMSRHPLPERQRLGDDELDSDIDSAAAVVTARFDDLTTQFLQTDAVERLTRSLEALLPFLP